MFAASIPLFQSGRLECIDPLSLSLSNFFFLSCCGMQFPIDFFKKNASFKSTNNSNRFNNSVGGGGGDPQKCKNFAQMSADLNAKFQCQDKARNALFLISNNCCWLLLVEENVQDLKISVCRQNSKSFSLFANSQVAHSGFGVIKILGSFVRII